MFNVIRIPTKFSKTIKRMSNEERLQVFDLLIKIWDWGEISPPDSIVWDVVQLIYGEWMNMEAKNGVKREKSSINLCSEWPGEVVPSDPGTRVEYSRVEENRVEESTYPENTQDKEIQNTKISDKWWEFCKLEWFASYTARVLIEKWWKPDMNTDEFTDWIAKFMEARDITYSESDYKKWKWAFQSMFTYWDEQDKWSRKKKMWLSRMTNQKWFKFNLPFTKK